MSRISEISSGASPISVDHVGCMPSPSRFYCSRGRSGRFSDSGLRISVCRLGAIGELGADGFDLRLRFGLRPGPFEIGPELRLLSRRTALDSWARSPHFVGRRESYSVSRLRRS
jgi:hypothetical protein